MSKEVLIKSRPTPIDKQLYKIWNNYKNIESEFSDRYFGPSIYEMINTRIRLIRNNHGESSLIISTKAALANLDDIQSKLDYYDLFFKVYVQYRTMLLNLIYKVSILRSSDIRIHSEITRAHVKTLIAVISKMVEEMIDETLFIDDLTYLRDSVIETEYSNFGRFNTVDVRDDFFKLINSQYRTNYKHCQSWYRYVRKQMDNLNILMKFPHVELVKI